MVVTRIELRDFRNLEHVDVELGEGLTVVAGPNGAGKTNLLEALYFGCTAGSPRTSNERELVRRGAKVARVVLDTAADGQAHRIEVGFEPGEAKHLQVDGSAVDSLSTVAARPLASVFLPDRLELVKGAPSGRRAHLDQVVAALWPARADARPAYSRALAQRNALVGRIRAGAAGPGALDAWDAELARQGIRLMENRAEAIEGLRPPLPRWPGASAFLAPRSSAIGRARRPSTPRDLPPSSPSAVRPTSNAASPRTGRTATRSRCCSAGCRCAPTAPRASSARRSWRCCSPSASCSRLAAAVHRSCSSTTSCPSSTLSAVSCWPGCSATAARP